MFFDQISEHVPSSLFTKKYIFVDPLAKDLPEEYEVLYYDTNKKYRDQFLSCIERVEEEYCIYISEDYILYDDVQTDLIEKYKNLLEKNGHLSFIRFVKGGVVDKGFPRFRNFEDLFEMHHSVPYFYTNQAAIWRTRDLEKIHRHGPNLHIANLDYENSFEYQATKTCRN